MKLVTVLLMLVYQVESFRLPTWAVHSYGARQTGQRVPVSMMALMHYHPQETQKIDLLYDSHCPLCAMQVEFLKKRDVHHRVKFTDLQSTDYIPSEHGNVDFERGMRKIRAVLPDQTVVSGMEVFRITYDAIGRGWMFALTNLPVVGEAADIIYDFWAENRLRITGRGELADELKERAEALRGNTITECDSDACSVDWD
jgi:predicted DCC family thiol-disulfide oxidoreductase YuxK